MTDFSPFFPNETLLKIYHSRSSDDLHTELEMWNSNKGCVCLVRNKRFPEYTLIIAAPEPNLMKAIGDGCSPDPDEFEIIMTTSTTDAIRTFDEVYESLSIFPEVNPYGTGIMHSWFRVDPDTAVAVLSPTPMDFIWNRDLVQGIHCGRQHLRYSGLHN